MFTVLKTIKKGDYVYALVPDHPFATKNGYVLMHRVVMENHLNRLLAVDEVVHHKDGNKHNNVISNLEVMNYRDHVKMHASTGRTLVELVCPQCGKHFFKEKRSIKKNAFHTFCSRSCNGKYQRARNWVANN